MLNLSFSFQLSDTIGLYSCFLNGLFHVFSFLFSQDVISSSSPRKSTKSNASLSSSQRRSVGVCVTKILLPQLLHKFTQFVMRNTKIH